MTDIPIGDKVKHVKSSSPDGFHKCHWPGCEMVVKPAQWGCVRHWYRLPKPLRDSIWAAYTPGQEKSKRPSAVYVEVAARVQEWILENWNTTNGQDTKRNRNPVNKKPRAT